MERVVIVVEGKADVPDFSRRPGRLYPGDQPEPQHLFPPLLPVDGVKHVKIHIGEAEPLQLLVQNPIEILRRMQ